MTQVSGEETLEADRLAEEAGVERIGTRYVHADVQTTVAWRAVPRCSLHASWSQHMYVCYT